MTTDEINNALAKWHTEHSPKLMWFFENGTLWFGQSREHAFGKPSYTESLDSIRLVEYLMTHEQRIGAAFQVEGFSYMATAEQRARAAVKVLGLEASNV